MLSLDRALDPTGQLDLDGLSVLEAELVERALWSDLLALYDLAIERAPDEQTGRSMMLRAALLAGEKLSDAVSAESYLRRVLSTEPENLDALDALRAICEQQGRLEEAAAILDQAIVVADPEEKIDLCIELAEIAHGGLDQPDRAVAALRYGYQIDPTRLDVLHRARAIYIAESRFAEAKAVLDAEADALAGLSDDPEKIQKLAEAYKTIGVRLLDTPLDHALAEDCLTKARQLGDNDALSRLDDLAALRAEWEAKAKSLRDQAMEARDKRKAAELYVGAAELFLAFGRDPVKSDESLKRALILAPGYLPALRFIERSVRDPARTPEVIGKLESAAQGVKDPATKASILIRAARLRAILEAESPEKKGSIASYDKVLAVDPASHEAAMALAGLLEQAGEYQRQAQILERHLEASTDPHRRVGLHLDLGRVNAELLGDNNRARAHFEAALKIEPGNFAAASALRALYTDAREAKPLLAVLRVLADHAPDRSSRLALLKELSSVAAEVGKEEAFDALRRVFQLDSSSQSVEAELEKLAGELKRSDALAETFAAAALRATGARAVTLSSKAARLYDQAGRPREAIDCFKRALELQPDDTTIRDALERLLRERNDPAALIDILELQLSRTNKPAEQAQILGKLGSLLDRELNEPQRAHKVYRKLVELEPNNALAVASLEDLAGRAGQHAEQAEMLERLEGMAAGPEKIELAARRARVLAQHLGKKAEAAGIYLQIASERQEDEAVISGLYAIAAEGVERRKIAETLEPIFGQRAQFERQVEMLRALIEEEEDGAKVAELSKKIGKILETRLQDLEGALDAYSQAAASQPGDMESHDSVLRLAHDLQRPERAAGLFSAILKDETLAPAAASVVGTALGALYDEQLDRKPDAIEAYKRALKADGTNAAAIAALERLYGAEERWKELAQLVEEQLKNAQDPQARAQLGVRLAAIREERLGEIDGAITVCKAVLAKTPDDRAALTRLADLQEKKGDLPDFLEVLDRLRNVSNDNEIDAALDVRAADVMRRLGGDKRAALERYRRVMAKQPEHSGALSGLEALLEEPSLGAEAGAALAPIYENAGRWRDLLAALEAQLNATRDARLRGALYKKIAQVKHDNLGQAEEAFAALAEAFEEGLLAPEERQALVRVGLAANQGADLTALLEAASEKGPTDLELLKELGRLYDGAVLDPNKAAKVWNRVLQATPGDREALLALERLHGAGDDPNALAEVLMARAAASTAIDEQLALYKRASAIYEEAVEDLKKATEAMEQARATAPRDRNTLVELQRLYERIGERVKVVELRHIEAQIVEDKEEKADVLLKLAGALADLDRDSEAVDSYRQILELVPERPAAREGLESLLDSSAGAKAALALEPYYRAQADWKRLVDVYERLAKASEDPAERVERLLAIRSIYEERLNRLDRAFNAASRALKDAPASEEVLASLERLAKAARIHDELIALYEDHADALLPRSPERVAIRQRLAKYLETLRMDRSQVLAAWRRVLEERPGDPTALEAIVRIATDMGDFDTTVSSLESLAEVLEEPAQKVEKLRTAARIIELQAGEPNRIIKLYERILSLIPGENEALTKLDGLYAQAGRHRDRERVLQEAITRSLPGANKELLLLRLGRLLGTKLGEPEEAIDILGQIVSRRGGGSQQALTGAVEALDGLVEANKSANPRLAAAAAALVEPYWREQGNGLKVVAAKEAQVAAIEDRKERQRLLAEIAGIYDKDLDQPALGFLALARAFTEAPSERQLGQELERLSHAADTREELADLYAQAIPQIGDESYALELTKRAAEIYDREVDRPESAVPHYDRVLAAQPDDISVMAALERIHRDGGNARGLVRILGRRLDLPNTPASEKKVLATEIAKLLESDIGDVDAAIAAHRARLALDPNDRGALSALAELAAREERPQVLAEALERLITLTDRPEDKAQLLVRLGKTRWIDLDDAHGGVDAFSAALVAKKNLPGAVQELGAIFREGGPAKARAAASLAPVMEEAGQWPELIACLEACADAATEPAAKKQLYVRIADVYEERLKRKEHAFNYGCRAFHYDPRDAQLMARIERLAAENGLFEDLAAFYLDEIDQVLERDLVLALRRRVADIYERELRDLERATTEHTKILELNPGDPETLRSLERLYKSAGSFESLAEVYRRRIAQAEEPNVRVGLMRELARVQSEFLDDAPGAIATLRRILDVEPNDLDAMERLAKLTAKLGRWSELGDVLEILIVGLDEAKKSANGARLELAKLRQEKLDDRVGAELLLREILEKDPKHHGAREYLRERIEDAVADDDPRAAIQASDILAEALRQTGEAQPLIEVLRVRVGVVADPESRVELNQEISRLYRHALKQPELAFTALTQAFRDAPFRADLRAELESLAEELLLLEDLVEVYEGSVSKISDPDSRLQLEVRIAELLEEKVGDRERALAARENVLKRRPMDPVTLEALDRLNNALGRWGALTDVLEKRIELVEDNDEAAYEMLVRLGTLWEERLDEPEEALSCFRRARNLKPRDARSLRALARLIDPKEAPQELYAVLVSLVERTTDKGELLDILPKMALLSSEQFKQRAEAIEIWRKVLELDPANVQAIAELEKLLEQEERWPDLAALLERQLKTAREEKELNRLQRKLAFVRGVRLGSVDDAVKVWAQILRKNPSDIEALEALRKIYREASKWEDLVAILRKLIPLQTDSEGVKGIRFELAEIFLQHLNRRDEAVESAKRVLDVEPHTHAQLIHLEELFLAAGAYHDAVRVMTLRSEQITDPGEKADVLFQIANIYETKMARRAGAAAAYERILQTEPSNVKAYDALAAIYEQAGDYKKLVDLKNRRIEHLSDLEQRKLLLFEVIDIYERRLGVKDLGFTAACRAFAEEGADPRAQKIAERLAEETGTWEILTEVFEEQVDNVPLPRAIELRRRLAEIYLEKTDEPQKAERQLDLVISIRPEDDGPRAQMADLYRQQGRWRDLISLTLDRIEMTGDLEAKKALHRSIAEVEEKELEDLDAAIFTHKRILDLDKLDEPSLQALIRLYPLVEGWRELVEILGKKADREESFEQRAEIRFQIAKVWDEKIEDDNKAIEAYRDVLMIDPGHRGALAALERLFTQAKKFESLLEVYERQVQLAEKPADQIDFLTRIAHLHDEELQDLRSACQTFERLLEIAPEHVPSMEELEALLRRAGDWSKLAELYQRHIGLIHDAEREVELYLALGEVQDSELDRGDLAEKSYQSALARDGSNREAIHRLGELYERQGSWFNALEMLQREARLIGSGPDAVDLHYRIGKINEDMLMDRPGAKVALKRAIDLDPGYLPAIRALAEIWRTEERWEDVLALEAQEAEHTENRQARADRYQQAAETAIERLGREEDAIKYYEKSLEAVHDHIPSVRALSDLYFVHEEWERAERLLEVLTSRLDRQDAKDELCRQYYRLAYISEKLDDDERALKRYLASYELDSTYLPTLEGLAAALLRAQRWEDAQRVFQTILVHHRESLTDAEVVDVYYQLGELAVRLGDFERARRSFDRALELDPNHPSTLRAYAALAEKLEEWEEAYDHRARLIDLLKDDDRFVALTLQAKLCRGAINDPYRAIDAYSEARKLRPDDEEVLSALAVLYRETSQHQRAIEAYEDLLKVAPAPKQRRDVALQLADVHFAQADTTRGVAALNLALDEDWECVDAFTKIEEVLGRQGKWTLLEENYRRMIERLPKDNSQRMKRVVLWQALGDLYRLKLKNGDGARMAYEVVLKLKPDEHATTATLAQLLSQRRETAPDALKLQHKLVSVVDDPAVPVRELFGLYEALNMRDRALCALSALVLMRVANQVELKAYELLLKQAPQQPSKSLDDKVWRNVVLHPDCRNSLADILSVLYRGAPELFGDAQNALALKKKEKVDLAQKGRSARSGLLYFNVWKQIASAMQISEMDHYHRPGSAQPPRLYPGAPMVLFAGEQHEVFREMPPKQVAWVLARQMACARPELVPARALIPEEVGAAVEGAVRLFAQDGSGVNLGIDPRLIQNWTRALQRTLTERALKALRQPIVTCLEKGELKLLPKYLEGVEHTASRAALLLCNDVRVADRSLGDPDTIVEMSYRRRARELMLFTMSTDYFALRDHLGVSLVLESAGAGRAR